jgi:hypothetical protein
LGKLERHSGFADEAIQSLFVDRSLAVACQPPKGDFDFDGCGIAKQTAENAICRERTTTQGLKPKLISGNLRGPEGPLFHGDGRIVSFRKL